MLIFIKNIFYIGSLFLSNLVTATPLNCISLKNQKCKIRPKIADIDINNRIYYPFSIKINKCSGSCNNINNSYAKICVPDTVINETRHIKWHETCKCLCRLDKIICNSKQRWNEDECRCECKELIDKDVCDKGYVSNSSNCECECDKSCNIGECLDYSSCKCRKKLIHPLIKECTENIDETKMETIKEITIKSRTYYFYNDIQNVM